MLVLFVLSDRDPVPQYQVKQSFKCRVVQQKPKEKRSNQLALAVS
jgi:hypothetical protein